MNPSSERYKNSFLRLCDCLFCNSCYQRGAEHLIRTFWYHLRQPEWTVSCTFKWRFFDLKRLLQKVPGRNYSFNKDDSKVFCSNCHFEIYSSGHSETKLVLCCSLKSAAPCRRLHFENGNQVSVRNGDAISLQEGNEGCSNAKENLITHCVKFYEKLGCSSLDPGA